MIIAHGPDEFTYAESFDPEEDEEFTVAPVDPRDFSWVMVQGRLVKAWTLPRRRWWHRLMFWRR